MGASRSQQSKQPAMIPSGGYMPMGQQQPQMQPAPYFGQEQGYYQQPQQQMGYPPQQLQMMQQPEELMQQQTMAQNVEPTMNKITRELYSGKFGPPPEQQCQGDSQ